MPILNFKIEVWNNLHGFNEKKTDYFKENSYIYLKLFLFPDLIELNPSNSVLSLYWGIAHK